jgi:hypothetical protein
MASATGKSLKIMEHLHLRRLDRIWKENLSAFCHSRRKAIPLGNVVIGLPAGQAGNPGKGN